MSKNDQAIYYLYNYFYFMVFIIWQILLCGLYFEDHCFNQYENLAGNAVHDRSENQSSDRLVINIIYDSLMLTSKDVRNFAYCKWLIAESHWLLTYIELTYIIIKEFGTNVFSLLVVLHFYIIISNYDNVIVFFFDSLKLYINIYTSTDFSMNVILQLSCINGLASK